MLIFQFDTVWAEGNRLSLEAFLAKVKEQSPDIQAEKSMDEEAAAKARGVRLSPPMVGIMNMNDSGGANRGIELSQEVPFPTKISNEKEVRDLEAKAQNSLYLYKRNEILLEARKAYFDFWRSFEIKKIIEEKQVWLKNHVKLSRSIARSDSAGQIHLLAVESELDQLENDVLEAQADLIDKLNTLKTYVPDLQTESLIPDSKPKIEAISIEKSTKSLLVESKEDVLKAVKSAKDYKKQSYWPDLFLRYRSFNGNEMSPKSEEIMIGVSLPFLFFWQPHSESAQATAQQHRAEAEVIKARVSSETQLKSLTEKSESLRKQIENLKNKLIPRANKRMQLVENLTVRTMEGLDEHRIVMLDYLEVRQREINAIFEFEKTNIEILKIVNQGDKL